MRVWVTEGGVNMIDMKPEREKECREFLISARHSKDPDQFVAWVNEYADELLGPDLQAIDSESIDKIRNLISFQRGF